MQLVFNSKVVSRVEVSVPHKPQWTDHCGVEQGYHYGGTGLSFLVTLKGNCNATACTADPLFMARTRYGCDGQLSTYV